MQTYWVRIKTEPGCSSSCVDMWCTGSAFGDGLEIEKEFFCFSVRAKDENKVRNMLDKIMFKEFEIDILETVDWKRYKDFAGEGTRYPMKKEYLDDEIDTVEIVLKRLEG